MTPTTRHVYFDTNLYIGTREGWDEIIAAEARIGIGKVANHYVAQELIRRLAESDVRERGKGLAGVKRLLKHSAVDGNLPILVTREVNFLRVVYQDTSAVDTLQQVYVRVLNETANIDPELWSLELKEFIRIHGEQAAKQKESIRQHFATQREKLERIYPLIAAEHPETKPRTYILEQAALRDQLRMIATGHIERTIASVGIPISDTRKELVADVMCKVMAIPLEHERRIRYGHFATAREQPNDILDNLILYSVHEHLTGFDLPIQLVTREKRILEVVEASPTAGVISFNDYMIELGLPHLQQNS